MAVLDGLDIGQYSQEVIFNIAAHDSPDAIANPNQGIETEQKPEEESIWYGYNFLPDKHSQVSDDDHFIQNQQTGHDHAISNHKEGFSKQRTNRPKNKPSYEDAHWDPMCQDIDAQSRQQLIQYGSFLGVTSKMLIEYDTQNQWSTNDQDWETNANQDDPDGLVFIRVQNFSKNVNR